ncbi:ATP-binding protein [Couchioplanes azureus]|uniref:ATP-binding protein n=1 Tax=Couchioplanes caeruleus TaxID=56438 RepID=UPI001671717B|nr:ATP-binding protein [Couchioplanes caeruleus]GGQ42792.1 hypothetical protein GCM10010166_08740 [Couchioplanes caeruleus subsp. azureus]
MTTYGAVHYGVTAGHVGYLRRSGEPPDFAAATVDGGQRGHRAALRLAAIGLLEGDRERSQTPNPGAGQRPRKLWPGELTVGLHTASVPLAFSITGSADGIAVEYATWSARPDGIPDRLHRRLGVLSTVLNAMFPSVTLSPVTPDHRPMPLAGVSLGIPAPAGDEWPLPIDRVIRGMAGHQWRALVLARPVPDTVAAANRQLLLSSMRTAQQQARAEGGPSPLTDQYVKLCEAGLSGLAAAETAGAWRTAVYLTGDADSYPRLAAVWRAAFVGAEPETEPVRVFTCAQAAAWAAGWIMPDLPAAPGPDGYRRPYELQTLLTSHQLGCLVQPPRQETLGYAVRTERTFDVEPVARAGTERTVSIGRLMRHGVALSARYEVPLDDLTRHAFVTGTTGSGKTNTTFAILRDVAAGGVPFLVIEPAKASYRALLDNPGVPADPLVYTLGDDAVAPLRMNPFEVQPGTAVQTHLDLLRSLFVASFGMWDPLPQILEQCLMEVYTDRGWDIGAGTNTRLGPDDADRSEAFPTLADLAAKAEDVIARLGYEDKISDNLRAALVTRVNGLRCGGKGTLLDTSRSTPAEKLFQQPVVLELERLGDDDDKAFVMGLILIRLVAFWRTRGYTHSLRHLLVIEEAHRLLAGTAPRSAAAGESAADPKAKAVGTFTNLLAEIREYGLGVLVADQVPVKLAPEVIKNTNLKVVHRLLAEDDRTAVGGTMAMSPDQLRALATFDRGVAAMFAEGDDAPVLVTSDEVKQRRPPPDDTVVRDRMAAQLELATCPAGCAPADPSCRAAADIAERPEVGAVAARVLTTVLGSPDRAAELWPGVGVHADAHLSRTPHADPGPARRCLTHRLCRTYAERRGAAAGWSYRSTAAVADALTAHVLAPAADTARALTETVGRVFRPAVSPLPHCTKVCPDQPCRYRYDAGRAARDRDLRDLVAKAVRYDHDRVAGELLEVARYAADRVVVAPVDPEADPCGQTRSDQAALCFVQQALLSGSATSVELAIRIGGWVCEAAELPERSQRDGSTT